MQKRRYRDLEVWQRSMDLAVITYQRTANYPASERYGMISQSRRAAVSVVCNIAEGQGRAKPGEFLNQLSAARGSLQELETLFILAYRLEYISQEEMQTLLERADRISRMLTGLRRSVEKRPR